MALDARLFSSAALADAGGVARLADWGLIRAQGADAASFLQSQLTADISALAVGEATLAGYCSPKGRLLASFIAWRSADDEFLLACTAELLLATLKRLSMFVLRAKCKLTDASAEMPLWGVAGAPASQWLGERDPKLPWRAQAAASGQVLRLPDSAGTPRWLLAQPADAAPPELPALEAGSWRALEVASGIVRIVGATVDQFVPQMVNFELVGGVNFKKGCYPGQEVVARSQYRGTLKRRAALLASPVPFSEGQEVFHDADPGQPAGMVALAASAGAAANGQHLALVEVKRALAEGPGSFHLGAADGPALQARALPYAIPSDAA